MAIMLIHEDIIYKELGLITIRKTRVPRHGQEDELFWFSRGPKLFGAKEKFCICELWGSSLRVPGSPAIALLVDCATPLQLYTSCRAPLYQLQGERIGSQAVSPMYECCASKIGRGNK